MPRKAKTPAKASNSIRSERKGASASTVVSSDSIASDLAAFRKSGGKIEVLGTTWALKKASCPSPDRGGAAAAACRTALSDPGVPAHCPSATGCGCHHHRRPAGCPGGCPAHNVAARRHRRHC